MSKQEKKELVPELRFPEFQDEGGWNAIKLIDTADKKIKWSFIGGPFGSNLKSSDYVDDGIRIIQLQNIGDAEFFDNYKIFTSKEKADELIANNIYPGEIILSKMGDPVGRACLIPDFHSRYVMCSDGIRLVVDEKSFSKYFVYTLINSVQFRSLVEKTATGSTRKRIGLDDLKKLPMIVPRTKEQKKIADCLSTIDEIVIAQSQKLEALKAHKKGLMQKLFLAEGETVPRLQFPEFSHGGEWQKSQLQELSTIIRGASPRPKSDPRYYGGNVPRLMGKDVSRDGKWVTPRIDFLTEDGAKLSRFCKKGTLTIICSGDVGVPSFLAIDACIHDGFLALVDINTSLLDVNYLFYCLVYLQNKFNESATHGGIYINLTTTILKEFEISVPLLQEQQKIADCLSSIDEIITENGQILESLKAHKKGLMQKLFPTIDEVGV